MFEFVKKLFNFKKKQVAKAVPLRDADFSDLEKRAVNMHSRRMSKQIKDMRPSYPPQGSPTGRIVYSEPAAQHYVPRSSRHVSEPVPVQSDNLLTGVMAGMLINEALKPAPSSVEHNHYSPDTEKEVAHLSDARDDWQGSFSSPAPASAPADSWVGTATSDTSPSSSDWGGSSDSGTSSSWD